MKTSKLIGRRVYFQDWYGDWNEWGIVVAYDGEYYHVAHAGDERTTLVFARNEIRVPRLK
jgi:hypothetical protein